MQLPGECCSVEPVCVHLFTLTVSQEANHCRHTSQGLLKVFLPSNTFRRGSLATLEYTYGVFLCTVQAIPPQKKKVSVGL